MALKLSDVAAAYPGDGSPRVLDGIGLEVGNAGCLAIVGPSGCGKSTLGRVLNGLHKPAAGVVALNDRDIRAFESLAEVRRRIGLLMQQPDNQLFGSTVGEDIRFGPAQAGLDGEICLVRMRQAMEQVGLDRELFAARSPFSLSGGERRRVALAGLLAMQPQHLVLDEPTAGLDPAGRADIESVIDLTARSLSVIVLTSDLPLAMRVADRLVLLDRGTVAFDGTPAAAAADAGRIAALRLVLPVQAELVAALRTRGLELPALRDMRPQTVIDFYPYRYLASEGFLPGYNFPRLPVRAFLPVGGDESTFLARPRFLALTEFGPQNIIYHEGRKFRVTRTLLPTGDASKRLLRAKLCRACGYFHQGTDADVCEQCAARLDTAVADTQLSLFEMTTATTQRVERITCEEEERVREGFTLSTHYQFSRDQAGLRKVDAVVGDASDGFALSYGPAATIWRINHGWRRARQEGFALDLHRGTWGRRPDDDGGGDTEESDGPAMRQGVKLVVQDTRNLLAVAAATRRRRRCGAGRELAVRAPTRHRGGVPAGGAGAQLRGARRRQPNFVLGGVGGRRGRAAPVGGGARRARARGAQGAGGLPLRPAEWRRAARLSRRVRAGLLPLPAFLQQPARPRPAEPQRRARPAASPRERPRPTHRRAER